MERPREDVGKTCHLARCPAWSLLKKSELLSGFWEEEYSSVGMRKVSPSLGFGEEKNAKSCKALGLGRV